MTRSDIVNEILEQTTPDELMFDIENTDIEWLADVTRDVIFQGTVGYNDVLNALIWFAGESIAFTEEQFQADQ